MARGRMDSEGEEIVTGAARGDFLIRRHEGVGDDQRDDENRQRDAGQPETLLERSGIAEDCWRRGVYLFIIGPEQSAT